MADNDPKAADPSSVGSDETLPALPSTTTPARTPSGGSGGRSGPGVPNYQGGDLVAERYRIIKPLGEGGMGEVYEAEDLLLRERVALKTLRDHVADDETSILRFKREIQLARRVTHPNVCRIFDVGIDRRGGREAAFLTMELLVGETLSQRVRKGGLLTTQEAMPIAAQIAGALAAAHAAGIIHRDLKCANVILEEGGRAVVTDFGLARAASEGSDQVTGDGGIVGSPAYMAPEQVEGGRRLTASADIYAFGVVLFEMVTGRLPFVGDSPLATAVKRVKEPPPSPKTLVPGLDERWERGILHAMGRYPEDRPASALEVLAELRGDSIVRTQTPAGGGLPLSTTSEVRKPRKRGRKRLLLVAGVLAAVCAAVVAADRQHGRSVPTKPTPETGLPGRDESDEADSDEADTDIEINVPTPPGVPTPPSWPKRIRFPDLKIPRVVVRSGSGETYFVDPRRSARRAVAIMGLKSLSGRKEDAYLSTAFSEMLSSELMAGNELRTIPGESVARAVKQLSLTPADSYARDTLGKLRGLLDADFVVSGSYLVLGEDKVRLDLKVQDTRSGDTLAAIKEEGDLDELNDIVAEAGEKLRGELHVDPPSEREREGARSLQPRKTDTARLYAEGLAQLRVDNCGAARGPLENAVAADPEFAQAHEALSEVLYCLGYEGRALEEARKALELSQNLPDDIKLIAEARMQQLTNENAKAAASYEALFERNPDNFDYGLRLMRMQAKTDRAKARQTLAALKKLEPKLEISAELALAEAQLTEGQVAPEKTLAMIQKARTQAEEQGMRLLAAGALLQEAAFHIELGDLKGAAAQAARAKEIFQASGDKDGIILSISTEVVVKARQGDDKAVERLVAEATELASQIDSVRSLVTLKMRLAQVKGDALQLDQAEALVGEAYQLLSRRGDHGEAVKPLVIMALARCARGDLRGAVKLSERAIAEVEDSHASEGRATALLLRALLQLRMDDGKSARETIEAAAEELPITAELGLTDFIDGAAALNEGEPAAAEAALRKALAADPIGKVTLPPFERERLLFESLLAQNKIADARTLVDKMRERAAKAGGSQLLQTEVDLAAARLKATSRKPADLAAAAKELSGLSDRMAKVGLWTTRLRADIARARIERAAGEASVARVLLAGVAREAGKRGYAALAKSATEALADN